MINRVFSEEWEDINLIHIYLFQTHLVSFTIGYELLRSSI